MLASIEDARKTLRKAVRNRHSLSGLGYYAQAYFESVARLREAGQDVCLELDARDQKETARALDMALTMLSSNQDSFEGAESGLNRIRTLWYSDIRPQLAPRTTSPRLPDRHLLAPELRNLLPRSLTAAFDQAQGCYAFEFWDATLVMVRKITESLIIEAYEKAGRASEIKSNGFYLQLGDLIGKAKSGTFLRLSRDSKNALDDVKRLGDNSAHNPKFSAHRSDVDGLRLGARILLQDLLEHIESMTTAGGQRQAAAPGRIK